MLSSNPARPNRQDFETEVYADHFAFNGVGRNRVDNLPVYEAVSRRSNRPDLETGFVGGGSFSMNAIPSISGNLGQEEITPKSRMERADQVRESLRRNREEPHFLLTAGQAVAFADGSPTLAPSAAVEGRPASAAFSTDTTAPIKQGDPRPAISRRQKFNEYLREEQEKYGVHTTAKGVDASELAYVEQKLAARGLQSGAPRR